MKTSLTEQDRPDVLKRRRAWFRAQTDLDPKRLVFVEETGASTKMTRLHGHWHTNTFIGAFRLSGILHRSCSTAR